MRNRQRERDLLGAAALLGGFVALGALLDTEGAEAFDRAAYAFADRHAHRGLERAQLPLKILGLPGAYMPAALLAARAMRRRGATDAGSLPLAALAAWLALRATRLVYHRRRPPRPAHRAPKHESSFPSGHTAGLTATALAAARLLRRAGLVSETRALSLGAGLPLAVAAHRVYVREHWATDVVGGWLLGAAAALAATAPRRPRRPRRYRGPRRPRPTRRA